MDLLAVQGTLKSLLQPHSSKASFLQHSAFFMVELSHLPMATGKTITLIRQTFVGKVMSLLFNIPSRLVITLLPRSAVYLYRVQLQLSAVWVFCPFQLQCRFMARVVIFHSTAAVYPVYGGCNVDLTPWMTSKGKISGIVILIRK